jgi:hypothetical protein
MTVGSPTSGRLRQSGGPGPSTPYPDPLARFQAKLDKLARRAGGHASQLAALKAQVTRQYGATRSSSECAAVLAKATGQLSSIGKRIDEAKGRPGLGSGS